MPAKDAPTERCRQHPPGQPHTSRLGTSPVTGIPKSISVCAIAQRSIHRHPHPGVPPLPIPASTIAHPGVPPSPPSHHCPSRHRAIMACRGQLCMEGCRRRQEGCSAPAPARHAAGCPEALQNLPTPLSETGIKAAREAASHGTCLSPSAGIYPRGVWARAPPTQLRTKRSETKKKKNSKKKIIKKKGRQP